MRLKQSCIYENFDLPLLLVTSEESEEIYHVCATQHDEGLKKITQKQEEKSNKITEILETGIKLSREGLQKENIKVIIESMLLKKLADAKTPKEIENAQLEIGTFKYEELEREELTLKVGTFQENYKKVLAEAQDIKNIAKILQNQLEIIAEKKFVKCLK